MSVIKKIMTLLRGSARELGEVILDANGVRIYEQEIHDARNAVAEAKSELTGVMAKEMQASREIYRTRNEIQRLEKLAIEALDKQKFDLAQEVAVEVAGHEVELERQTQLHADYAAKTSNLKNLIKTAEATVREHERAIQMVKSTESVHRATQSISESINTSGSKLVSAKESLERIQKRHEDLSDRMEAAQMLDRETGTRALEQKLAQAGIGEDSQREARVMERLRAQHAEQTSK